MYKVVYLSDNEKREFENILQSSSSSCDDMIEFYDTIIIQNIKAGPSRAAPRRARARADPRWL